MMPMRRDMSAKAAEMWGDRVSQITYSTDDRVELAERIVELEDFATKLREENEKLRRIARDILKRMRGQEEEWGLDVMSAQSLSPDLLQDLHDLGIKVRERKRLGIDRKGADDV